MRLIRRRPPGPPPNLTQAELNRWQNMNRILYPPQLTLRERLSTWAWKVEETWCRHVTQRELYRCLDRLGPQGRRRKLRVPADPEAVRRARIWWEAEARARWREYEECR